SDPIAHLTAVGNIVLKPDELIALQKFMDAGGLLLFDAAGGSTEASESMQAILAAMYPAARNEPLPIDHPIYRGDFPGGRAIESVTYRQSDRLPSTRLPRLRGLTLNGGLLAIISPEDISAALVGYPRTNLAGYSPQSAAELVRAILLWNCAHQK
ncbi:MAG: DUF4159 domain-containing protein, partial [Phycisphaerae bacterium]|nr:DUF4159 domain-containing protein [Phycisphaerae bacterium]